MRGCLQILAGIVAVFFILTAAVAVIVWPLLGIVTDREAMLEALSGLDEVITAAAPRVIANAMAVQAAQSGLEGVEIDESMLTGVVDELLPPGWVDAQAETAVNTLYDVLETGNLDDASVTVDTSPVIEQLKGPAGKRLVATVVQGIPACAEPLDLNELLNGGSITIPSCLPPEISRELVVQEAHAQFVEALDENPQLTARAGVIQVPLSEVIGTDTPEAEAARQQITQVRRLFLLAQRWGWVLWLLPVMSLLLIAVLAVRSVSELGHWWGWPLGVTAVLVFFLTLILPGFAALIAETIIIPTQIDALASSMRELARSVVSSVTEMWRSRVYLQAGAMLGVGLLLIAIGFFTKPTQNHEFNE
ncbi:MAG: hypothetical protein DWQ04_23160 [Chloroflexi bacterium]|nr:MAG: hypothetical protein DWQ04_23160 [Chloroflexota bacterium]